MEHIEFNTSRFTSYKSTYDATESAIQYVRDTGRVVICPFFSSFIISVFFSIVKAFLLSLSVDEPADVEGCGFILNDRNQTDAWNTSKSKSKSS